MIQSSICCSALSTVTVLEITFTQALGQSVNWTGTTNAWKAMARLTELRLGYSANEAFAVEAYNAIGPHLPSSVKTVLLWPFRLCELVVSDSFSYRHIWLT